MEMLSPEQHRLVLSLIRNPNSAMAQRKLSMLQQKQSLTHEQQQPASGAIFGILKQMKEDFETNIKTSSEAEAKSDFAALKASKEKEIKAGQEQIDTKTVEMA